MKGYSYQMAAHETTYGGLVFRSRLEATWAAYFDLRGVRWDYEPADMPGWVPDFILYPQSQPPILVEVKPLPSISAEDWPRGVVDEFKKACRVAGVGGWFDGDGEHEREGPRALLVGTSPVALGAYYQEWSFIGCGGGTCANPEPISHGDKCGGGGECGFPLSPTCGSYACWWCGGYDGATAYDTDATAALWRRARGRTRATYGGAS